MRTIWFKEKWPKLEFPVWTTIRQDKGTNYYKLGDSYKVENGTWRRPKDAVRLGICNIIGLRKITVEDITEPLARFDANCSRTELVQMLEKWYGSNPKLFLIFGMWITDFINEAMGLSNTELTK